MNAAEIAAPYCVRAAGAVRSPTSRARSRSHDGTTTLPAPARSPAPSAAATAKSNGRPSWALGGGVKPRSRQREHVELRRRPEEFDPWRREREQVVRVSIGDGPWRDLRAFARASADGRDVGGFLFAQHLRSWERGVSIARATVAFESRAEHAMSLDLRALAAEERWIHQAEADSHFGEAGTWHTHLDGDDRPSEADLAQWLNGRDVLERPYVGLILTAAADDPLWSSALPHGWIVRRTASGLAVCEPAEVETRASG
jgi:proteasome lid subunit RPN8/RPN11